jgi:hypothetical protein
MSTAGIRVQIGADPSGYVEATNRVVAQNERMGASIEKTAHKHGHSLDRMQRKLEHKLLHAALFEGTGAIAGGIAEIIEGSSELGKKMSKAMIEDGFAGAAGIAFEQALKSIPAVGHTLSEFYKLGTAISGAIFGESFAKQAEEQFKASLGGMKIAGAISAVRDQIEQVAGASNSAFAKSLSGGNSPEEDIADRVAKEFEASQKAAEKALSDAQKELASKNQEQSKFKTPGELREKIERLRPMQGTIADENFAITSQITKYEEELEKAVQAQTEVKEATERVESAEKIVEAIKEKQLETTEHQIEALHEHEAAQQELNDLLDDYQGWLEDCAQLSEEIAKDERERGKTQNDFMKDLQEQVDKATLSEHDLFEKKLDTLGIMGKQRDAAWDMHDALEAQKMVQDQQKKDAEASKMLEHMMNFGNAENISTAIGGVKVAGMTSFSLERMMPTQDAIKLAVQQIAKNTAPLAAGAP